MDGQHVNVRRVNDHLYVYVFVLVQWVWTGTKEVALGSFQRSSPFNSDCTKG